jgi:hypothetical protein
LVIMQNLSRNMMILSKPISNGFDLLSKRRQRIKSKFMIEVILQVNQVVKIRITEVSTLPVSIEPMQSTVMVSLMWWWYHLPTCLSKW